MTLKIFFKLYTLFVGSPSPSSKTSSPPMLLKWFWPLRFPDKADRRLFKVKC